MCGVCVCVCACAPKKGIIYILVLPIMHAYCVHMYIHVLLYCL